ncbi:UDP-N-acetylmuramoyl-L-alanine--D-glutamate ligase [Brevundimonas terrae]|uniref:UDP-N-acetylmuramoylalanine--D-glutamate ligase n=1 Tax=Brevundimonas terrae TaxID=363631 RepID=A0ABP3I4E8_9CAUL|nr:UDP-N-acetylmuramoyl-L-alanine--D-glutamate ligase [Brevundimonas terrae]NIJ26333.1 UDP-N-acetylmuramoylalanine--D-glutamate ligase [Brevundimonas terrae]
MIPVPGFEGRRVAVFGLGRSGITAARALQAGGALPVLWDDGVSGRMQAEAEGFNVEDLTVADWSGFDALVLSPGAPLTHPKPHWTVDKAHAAGIPVIGDIELFARALDALPADQRPRVVAITGTNGKSTTTALIAYVLKQAGLKVHMGGNIGIGVLALPTPTPDAVYVIEVSSYQLDLTTSFAPDVAILTNISPDHLDRHGGMEGYVKAKARIFQSQPDGALALIGIDEDWGKALADRLEGEGANVRRIATARLEADLPTSGWQAAPALLLADEDRIDLSDARSLPGRHNAQNAAFAYATATALGVAPDVALSGLKAFPGLAHRMEAVGRINEVRFINDSKGTNADAAAQALASYPAVFWIAGGKAKEGGIESLRPLFGHVTKAYLIGEAADAFAVTLGDVPHVVAHTIERAVQMAAADAAKAGGEQVVLLSPACASFDQFPDFEVRGEAFRAAVLALGATAEVAL